MASPTPSRADPQSFVNMTSMSTIIRAIDQFEALSRTVGQNGVLILLTLKINEASFQSPA